MKNTQKRNRRKLKNLQLPPNSIGFDQNYQNFKSMDNSILLSLFTILASNSKCTVSTSIHYNPEYEYSRPCQIFMGVWALRSGKLKNN